ncbi:hypothetical protein PR048_025627 [Dryococelus australis]|uniref:Reverse transcriptase/retrotransposon-derived protein RNase H-like domain-containing protein n=1 Tax=Dryococelus australis TaxID=614101 RepID=A0ABQ9GRX9_9NEOP|nr:hypothetical protein PR048_025627 [Dryococelus australis]
MKILKVLRCIYTMLQLVDLLKRNMTQIKKNEGCITVYSLSALLIFWGYVVSHKHIVPDLDSLEPLRTLPVPTNTPLHRAQSMFSLYTHLITKFAEKLQCLLRSTSTLNQEAVKVFEKLKSDVEAAVVYSIYDEATFTVESDASDFVVGATLSQNNSLYPNRNIIILLLENKHVQLWKPYENGGTSLWADIVDSLEHSAFKYDIIYRPGKENGAAYILSRICTSIKGSMPQLFTLHEALSSGRQEGRQECITGSRARTYPFH